MRLLALPCEVRLCIEPAIAHKLIPSSRLLLFELRDCFISEKSQGPHIRAHKKILLIKKKKGRVYFNFREIGEESLQQVNNGSVAFRYFLGNVRFCEIIFFQYLALLH